MVDLSLQAVVVTHAPGGAVGLQKAVGFVVRQPLLAEQGVGLWLAVGTQPLRAVVLPDDFQTADQQRGASDGPYGLLGFAGKIYHWVHQRGKTQESNA